MSIITTLRTHESCISSPVTYRENSYENILQYRRAGGTKRVEITLCHLPDVSGESTNPPVLCLAEYKTRSNPNFNATALLNFSMEEARLLRDFLNRPEIQGWLEA